MCGTDVFLGILAVFFPPVSVWIKVGICTADSIINIALCCLGYVPGLLHAWYIILKYPDPDHDGVAYEAVPGNAAPGRDVESGRARYYYVAREPIQHPSQRGYGTVQSPQPQPQPQGQSQPARKPQRNDESGGSSAQSQDDSRAPPTYAEAVRGDNKVQSQDE